MGESAGDGDSESGTRVKRLSSQSQASASGLGMVLTIADDADVVIMGHQRGTPEVPSVPDVVPEPEETQPRSLSALAGRLSRKKGHASLFAHSRPRTAPTPNPTLHEHTLVEEFMKQNGTMQAEVNTMRDDMKLIAEISEQPSKPPASQMMKQVSSTLMLQISLAQYV